MKTIVNPVYFIYYCNLLGLSALSILEKKNKISYDSVNVF